MAPRSDDDLTEWHAADEAVQAPTRRKRNHRAEMARGAPVALLGAAYWRSTNHSCRSTVAGSTLKARLTGTSVAAAPLAKRIAATRSRTTNGTNASMFIDIRSSPKMRTAAGFPAAVA